MEGIVMEGNCNIEGKKLLVLGGVPMIRELVEDAQKRGAYVIVSDYLENSSAKEVADEAWLISTADTEALAEKCIEVGVDGVISAFDDFNIFCSQRLSERLDKPFYATGSQLTQMMDKKEFKHLCVKNGVPSTKEFVLDEDLSPECLAAVEYPAIMKPVDLSGSRGITIVRNEEELLAAYHNAMDKSRKKSVVLEKYMEGDEVGVNYILQDGKIHLSVMHDRYMQKQCASHIRLPLAYVYPSKYTQYYLENENQKVIDMFHSIGMENGTLFLQGCVDHSVVHFYETGYRINGAKQYQLLDSLCGFNPMQMIVNHSLTGKMAEVDISDRVNPMLTKHCCTLSILIRSCTIGSIQGLDTISAMPETEAITQWLREGEDVPESAVGTQKQIAMRITLSAETLEGLADAINAVYKTLVILDTAGENAILEQFDTNLLFQK